MSSGGGVDGYSGGGGVVVIAIEGEDDGTKGGEILKILEIDGRMWYGHTRGGRMEADDTMVQGRLPLNMPKLRLSWLWGVRTIANRIWKRRSGEQEQKEPPPPPPPPDRCDKTGDP